MPTRVIRSRPQCDFNDGLVCDAEATDFAIEDGTGKCFALVCEDHANELAGDSHMQRCEWFKVAACVHAQGV